ncbi:MAG TPA: hypothetical protein VHD37_03120 [Candidatus Paceibacterota bacterium]|nr:hypothetical protein [Candidatus Paceibacterota bacterium]
MARVALPQSKLKARRRKRRLVVLASLMFVLLLAAAGLVALCWAPFMRIQGIDVAGVSSANPDAVVQEVRGAIAGAYWGLFPRDNIFLYPKDEIRAGLMARHAAFGSVALSREGFSALRVDVVERAPKALWCGESAADHTPCLTLDENGAAYALAPDFSGSIYMRYAGQLPQGPLPRQFLAPDRFRALSALADELSRRLSSTTITLVSVEDGTEARVDTASGFIVSFSLDDSGADVLERLNLALSSQPFREHALSDFEYLDLRFGDKLYYKLRKEKEESSQEE